MPTFSSKQKELDQDQENDPSYANTMSPNNPPPLGGRSSKSRFSGERSMHRTSTAGSLGGIVQRLRANSSSYHHLRHDDDEDYEYDNVSLEGGGEPVVRRISSSISMSRVAKSPPPLKKEVSTVLKKTRTWTHHYVIELLLLTALSIMIALYIREKNGFGTARRTNEVIASSPSMSQPPSSVLPPGVTETADPPPAPPPAPLPPPVPPATAPVEDATVVGSVYPNLFKDLMGKSKNEIESKLGEAWDMIFLGDAEVERIYYAMSDGKGIVENTEGDFVTSEGISYGMMAAVQYGRKLVFDRIYNWAITYMRHADGPLKGLFAWQCATNGTVMDPNSAPDGEEWMASALIFANKRWGSGDKFNYEQDAMDLLKTLANTSLGVFTEQGLVAFYPGANFTDPSYHLPHFYQLWARFMSDRNEHEASAFWTKATQASRAFLKKTVNPKNGLSPDYSTFDGKPIVDEKGHENFQFDAWRVVINTALDWSWWKADAWERHHADLIQNFFASQGIRTYGATYALNGTELKTFHPIGLVAANAVASLAATNATLSKAFVSALWDARPEEDKYRYYSDILLFLGLLEVSGTYQCHY